MGHFIVAGAGIAGLAVALALGRDGHRVDIFERRGNFEDGGAGLQLSPNATRVAAGLGILGRLRDVAIAPRLLRLRRGRDGGTIAAMPLGDAVARHGAPFLLLHRADLQRVLGEAAAAAGIRVVFSAELTQFDPQTGTVRMQGARGPEVLSADGLIRADGVHATRRDRGPDGASRFSNMWAWRSLVPAAMLPASVRAEETQLCLGRAAHLVHYPLRSGSVVNLVAVLAQERPRPDVGPDIWSEPGDSAVLQAAVRDWHPSIRQLIEAAPGWRRWPLFDGAGDAMWSTGRLTAVGDAAHPMLPFLAQGASQAFEDAAALARAVSATPTDVPAAFGLYEARRSPTVRRVQQASRRQGRIYHLGGAAAAARDLAMALLGPDRLLERMSWLYGTGRVSETAR